MTYDFFDPNLPEKRRISNDFDRLPDHITENMDREELVESALELRKERKEDPQEEPTEGTTLGPRHAVFTEGEPPTEDQQYHSDDGGSVTATVYRTVIRTIKRLFN